MHDEGHFVGMLVSCATALKMQKTGNKSGLMVNQKDRQVTYHVSNLKMFFYTVRKNDFKYHFFRKKERKIHENAILYERLN